MKEEDVLQNQREEQAMDKAVALTGKITKNPKAKKDMIQIYQDEGVNRASVAKALKKGLEAKKVFWDSKEGKAVETFVDDHKVQLEAAKIVADIFGDRNRKEDNSTTKIDIKVSIEESNKMEEAVRVHLEEKFGKKKKDAVDVEVID